MVRVVNPATGREWGSVEQYVRDPKKYGGGGHLNACGCTLNTWEDADKLIKDLDNLVEENK